MLIRKSHYLKILLTFLVFLFSFGSCSSSNPIYDTKIKKLLEKEKLSFEIDKDGDFKILFPLKLEGEDVVWENIWIISRLKEHNNIQVRELFGLVINLPETISPSLLESLMMDSYNNRFFGSWVVIQKEGRFNFLAYLVKIPLGSLNKNNLNCILEEIAYSISSMREVLLTSQEKEIRMEPTSGKKEINNHSYDYYSWGEEEEYYPPAFESPQDIPNN